MKKLALVIIMLFFTTPCLAVTVGGPDISVPQGSLFLKQQAVDEALDRYEYNMNVKANVYAEFITRRKLHTSSEVTNAKIEGQNFVLKLSDNFGDVFEPYIKVGTCNLKVRWEQNGDSVTLETGPGLVWGGGAKVKLWESESYKVKLTLDAQYRRISADVDNVSIDSAADKNFELEEWQLSLLASKKYVIPMGFRDCYIIPYGGLTYSRLDVDASFTAPSGAVYSTYHANDEDEFGIVIGFDAMPSLLSWYLINFELKLVNETAVTVGGTLKF